MSESQSWWRGSGNTDQAQPNPTSFKSKPMEIPQDAEGEELLTRRVHILGMGSIGTLIAHSLRCLPSPPPITLLLHRPDMYEVFKSKARVVRLINKKSDINDEQTGFDVEVLDKNPDSSLARWRFYPSKPDPSGNPTTPWKQDELLDSGEFYIHSLIVTVKGPATAAALRSVKHRLNAQSTICLMQNGLGQVDELNKYVFTDPATRPTYLLGVISHGCYMSSHFVVIHAGFGTTALGIYRDPDKYPLPSKNRTSDMADLTKEQRKSMYPTDKELYSNISARFLLRTLTRSPVLACATFPYLDLLQLQLEKLSCNALLNPMTALLDVPNGRMLDNGPLSAVQRLLLAEISLVIRSLPEFEGVPNIRARFSPERLETLFTGVTKKTAENSSSMREDMRKGRNTEIDYINGYIVKRGEEQGIKCVLNFMIQQLVKGKSNLQSEADGKYVPYGTSRVQGEIQRDDTGEPSAVTFDDRDPGKK